MNISTHVHTSWVFIKVQHRRKIFMIIDDNIKINRKQSETKEILSFNFLSLNFYLYRKIHTLDLINDCRM